MKNENNLALVEVMFGIYKNVPKKSTYINEQLMLTSDLDLSRHQNYIV